MLVLSRRINESVIIGDKIRVYVAEVDGNTVKLGIEAPRSIRVLRKELFDANMKANLEAILDKNKPISIRGIHIQKRSVR
ncbi:MAG: carbon storage regulator [Verrucomicrobia bacterium GWF2_51_19]|nr:MAG: carbon storage regulator [Verrucomicrobia bacterium GWF2_51_19]HCJ11557.1 carbon storage regulator [Opitutae bacterium]